MLNKKIKKLFVLGAACLMLTSCGEIIAKPNGYDEDKILENIELEGSDLNNLMSTIYDAMHDSSTLSKTTIAILNEKLFEHYFGSYSAIEAAYKDNTKVAALVNEHKAYQELDEDGNRLTTQEAKELEANRVKRTFERIQNLVSDKLYSTLESSDYKDKDGLFSEKLFALGVYKKLYQLDPTGTYVKWNDFISHYSFYDPILLVPYTDLYNEETSSWDDKGSTQQKGIIHITSVTNTSDVNTSSPFGYYREYIVNEILPDIYQHMLAQYYLYSQEYSSLGSKYARKVTYISIAPNGEQIYSTKHADLVNYFARVNVLTGDKAATDLYSLQDAWVGYKLSDAKKALLEGANFTKVTVDVTLEDNGLPALTDEATLADFKETYKEILSEDGLTLSYYEGTLFGSVIEQFRKIHPSDIKNSSKSAEAKFSGNNTHSYYEGLVDELNSLTQKKMVVDEWGLKADGFASLDSTIKERLMSISVATDLEKPAEGETYSSNYLQYTQNSGNFYLLPEQRLPSDPIPFVLSSGTTKYIVQVEEAASVAKLSKRGNASNKYAPLEAEDIAYEICNLLADDGTVKTNTMEFLLEESEILYHDDKILEYFKSNYASLFED